MLRKFSDSGHVSFFSRLIVGGVLSVAGINKLLMGTATMHLITNLRVIPECMVQPLGILLPRAELILGYFLIIGLLTRFAAGLSIIMILGFIVVNVLNLAWDVESCGCFGQVNISTQVAIIIDVLMLAMSASILFSKAGFLSLDSELKLLMRSSKDK